MQLANEPYLLQTILNAPTGICILDAGTLKAELINTKFLEISGKSHEALLDKYYWDAFAEARPYHEQPLNSVIEKGEAYNASEIAVTLARHNKPEMVYVNFVYSPIKGEDGSVVKVTIWLTENADRVTDRKEITELNKTLESKGEQPPISQLNIRNMILQAPVGMCIVSGEPLFVDEINDIFLEIIGKKREAFMAASFWEVNNEARSIYEPITNQVLETGQTYSAKEQQIARIRFGKQETVFVDFVYEPMRDVNKRVIAIMIVATDVTDKVLARRLLQNSNKEMAASNEEIAASNDELSITNEELAATQQQLMETLAHVAESEERFRTMAEGSGILITVGDHTGNAIYFNKAWEEISLKSTDQLLVYGWTDLIHPDDREEYVKSYLGAFKYRVPFTGEFRVLYKQKEYRWLLATNTPRFRRDGSFAGYISSYIDITERKYQEEERTQLLDFVKASEQKLKQIIDQMRAHVVILRGKEMIIESANQLVFAFWKKTKQIIGKPLLEVLPELKGQPFPNQLDKVFATGEPIYQYESPVELENEDGTIRKAFVDYSYQALNGPDGKPSGVLVMSFDVTERVNARNLPPT